MVDSIQTKFGVKLQEMSTDLYEACKHHDPNLLTESQKVALAVALGVPFRINEEFVTTPEPFTLSIDRHGEWKVKFVRGIV